MPPCVRLAVALLVSVGPGASDVRAQQAAEVPSLVVESSGVWPIDGDIAPAAWRLVHDVDANARRSVAQSEFRDLTPNSAPRDLTPLWLTLRLHALAAEDVPALVETVRRFAEARGDVRVVEIAPARRGDDDDRVVDFLTRRLSVTLKSGSETVGIARAVASAADVERLRAEGVVPLLDVVVLPDADVAAAAARLIAEHGLTLRTAVLAQAPGESAQDLAAREIGRLGAHPDIAGYVLPGSEAAGASLLAAVRTLARPVSQPLAVIDADIRLTSAGRDVSDLWRTRVLFGTDSLATYVVVDVPEGAPLAATLRLVLPVAGSAALLDPARAREIPLPVVRDQPRQASEVEVALPSPGRWLIDMHREADASFVQREDVSATRQLTVDEIIARHQLRQAATRRAAGRYVADGTMQQYFRPTVTDPGFDVFTENRYYVEGDRVEWEELSFSVNGARWDENRPPFPLLQPEKVLSPPLVVELDQRYRYRLAGTERVDGRDCYVVRFDPVDTEASLYSGSVWIDTRTFARVKQQVVQTNLVAPVISNDETQTFAPVPLPGGGEAFLPVHSYTQQLLLIAGRNLLVERRMAFTRYVIEPDDFEARREAARRSDRVMYVETDRGVRYFVKDDTGARVVSDEGTRMAKAQAIGVTIDPSYAFPLPMFGINYLNFEFLGRKDTQLALLFGGVLAAGNIQRPQVAGRRVDLNVDFFAIAAPGSDRFYDETGEHEDVRLLTWPLTTGVNLGFQATSYQKVTAQLHGRFDGFVRDRTTAGDYVTPSSTVTAGLGALYEYRRAGYSVTASGVFSRRASWRPWGRAGALEHSSRDYEKYALNATKTFYFGPFSKVVVNGAWFTGRRLDRFSRYQFGLFDETRIHGVPSSGVRYGELAMARGQYSFNVFEQYRLDLFLDRAWGRTREVHVPWEGLTGVGMAVNFRIPRRNLILRADIGKSFLPDRYRRIGSTVVQVMLLRPMK